MLDILQVTVTLLLYTRATGLKGGWDGYGGGHLEVA